MPEEKKKSGAGEPETQEAPEWEGQDSNSPRHAVPNSDKEATRDSLREAARKTQDFALLNPSPPPAMQANFTESDTWRVLRIQSEFVHSFELMADVGPAVAIFGSA